MRRVGEYPLWIGTARDARDIRAVLDAGIEAVVDLAVEEPPVHPTRELIYVRVPLRDGAENPERDLTAAVNWVAYLVAEGVWTMVACGGGMSRSVAVAAAAVGLIESERPVDVLRRIAEQGPVDVSPGLWQDVTAVMHRRAGKDL
jgi:hypothetical protein